MLELSLAPEQGFEAAARLVLDYLDTHVPLAMWSVTRVENGRQTFLHVDPDNVLGVTRGDGHRWQDGFCVRMAAGAPTVAPDVRSLSVYADAAANRSGNFGAYAGAAIREPSGAVFGTICGLHPQPLGVEGPLAQAGDLLRLLGSLLSMVLASERTTQHAAVALLESQLSAESDPLSGLYNRRAWNRLAAEEAERSRRLGEQAVVAMLDLDHLKRVNDTEGHEAGDRYIRLAGSALASAVTGTDVVARLGGDEFAVLLRGCPEAAAPAAVARIEAALEDAGVAGSLGWAPLTVRSGLSEAMAAADREMYAVKAARRAGKAS